NLIAYFDLSSYKLLIDISIYCYINAVYFQSSAFSVNCYTFHGNRFMVSEGFLCSCQSTPWSMQKKKPSSHNEKEGDHLEMASRFSFHDERFGHVVVIFR